MSEESTIQLDENIIKQLVEATTVMSAILSRASDLQDAQGEKLAYFKEELVQVRDSLRHIAKVLLEGNGDRPLISRVAVLEEQVKQLEEHETEERIQKRIHNRGKYAVGAAVISGLAGVVTGLISLLS